MELETHPPEPDDQTTASVLGCFHCHLFATGKSYKRRPVTSPGSWRCRQRLFSSYCVLGQALRKARVFALQCFYCYFMFYFPFFRSFGLSFVCFSLFRSFHLSFFRSLFLFLSFFHFFFLYSFILSLLFLF